MQGLGAPICNCTICDLGIALFDHTNELVDLLKIPIAAFKSSWAPVEKQSLYNFRVTWYVY